MLALFQRCPSRIQSSSVVGSSFGRGMLVVGCGFCSLLGCCSLLVAISSDLSGFFCVYLLFCCACSCCCWLGAGNALFGVVGVAIGGFGGLTSFLTVNHVPPFHDVFSILFCWLCSRLWSFSSAFFCSPQACPSELDIVGLMYVALRLALWSLTRYSWLFYVQMTCWCVTHCAPSRVNVMGVIVALIPCCVSCTWSL